MLVTLSGAVVSDGLDDGRVVSGVGGQYNFVAMAQELPDGHSILQIRSTRSTPGGVQSNVVFNYGHITIPRHLRDIIVTEYGIADIRGKTDEEIVIELLKVADSRFQAELMAQAKAAGKLDPHYELPEEFQSNLPESYAEPMTHLRDRGFFPPFPFGTDFTPEEIVLGRALRALKAKVGTRAGQLLAAARALSSHKPEPEIMPYLDRMGLADPHGFSERLYQRLIAQELRTQLGL